MPFKKDFFSRKRSQKQRPTVGVVGVLDNSQAFMDAMGEPDPKKDCYFSTHTVTYQGEDKAQNVRLIACDLELSSRCSMALHWRCCVSSTGTNAVIFVVNADGWDPDLYVHHYVDNYVSGDRDYRLLFLLNQSTAQAEDGNTSTPPEYLQLIEQFSERYKTASLKICLEKREGLDQVRDWIADQIPLKKSVSEHSKPHKDVKKHTGIGWLTDIAKKAFLLGTNAE